MIADISRVDPDDVADSYPDVPIVGFGGHTDTAGLRRAHEAGFDQVLVKNALQERAPQIVEELIALESVGRRTADRGDESTDDDARVTPMTYIIAEPCIDIKDLSCVDVCPVDCIHQADRILVIDPEECIDCGACEPECPVEAIFPEDALPDKWQPFVEDQLRLRRRARRREQAHGRVRHRAQRPEPTAGITLAKPGRRRRRPV